MDELPTTPTIYVRMGPASLTVIIEVMYRGEKELIEAFPIRSRGSMTEGLQRIRAVDRAERLGRLFGCPVYDLSAERTAVL